MQVPILMLGSDFQYAFAPSMGAESLTSGSGYNTADPRFTTNAATNPTFWLAKPYTGSVPAGYTRRDPNDPNSYNAEGALAYDYTGAPTSAAGTNKVAAAINASGLDVNNALDQGFSFFKSLVEKNKPGSFTIDQITQMFKEAKGDTGTGFDFEKNLPMILIGGAAIVAIMFMAGTRKRA